MRAAFRTVLDCAKQSGQFLPILAAANEELNRFAAGRNPDTGLGTLLR